MCFIYMEAQTDLKEIKSESITMRVTMTELNNIRTVVKMEGGKNLSSYVRNLILSRKPLLTTLLDK